MKKLFPFLLTVIFLFAIISCKPGGDKKKINETEKTSDASFPTPLPADGIQTNNRYSTFDITAPEGWEKQDTLYMGNRMVIIFSPIEDATDDFRENLNVLTEKTGMDPDDYFDLSRKNIQKMLTNAEELDNGTTEINGLPGHWLRYNHNYQGYLLEVKAYIVMKNGTAYIITCTSKKGEMDKWSPQFEQAVNSFTLN
jgi:hypothetical protein